MFDFEVIARIAERKIQEAIDEGKFDNLPGKGKPIVFDEDFVTPAHLRLANQVLKNAGVLPDWIQYQQDVTAERKEVARLRAHLMRENQTRRARALVLPASDPYVAQYIEWHTKNRALYLRRLKGVNTSILKYCMIAPTSAQPLIPCRIEPEMEAFDSVFPALDGQPAAKTPATAEESDSRIKLQARERYLLGHPKREK